MPFKSHKDVDRPSSPMPPSPTRGEGGAGRLLAMHFSLLMEEERTAPRFGARFAAAACATFPSHLVGSRADRTPGRIRCLRRWDARFGPHPQPLSRKQERGDSGERVWPPIAVYCHDEHLFGPPLNLVGEGLGERGDRSAPSASSAVYCSTLASSVSYRRRT
jgi:hypothetical protein